MKSKLVSKRKVQVLKKMKITSSKGNNSKKAEGTEAEGERIKNVEF